MQYIETLKEGNRVSGVYLCKQKTIATTKTGKEYYNVTIQDKTGCMDLKIWEPNSPGIREFDAMDYIEILGKVTSFNGALQLSAENVRVASEGEYVPDDYFPTSERSVDDMYKELVEYIGQVQNVYLSKLLKMFFIEDKTLKTEFMLHSAAKSVHHGFIGGLLQHTVSVTKMCAFYCEQYPILNKDLLLTAAMLHDIGKIKELSPFPENDYTDDGQLLGHIVIGSEMIGLAAARIEGFPVKLLNELKHCVLAHHGEYEFGSPKKPAIIEAVALNFADNTDAKLEIMLEIFNGYQSNEKNEWLGYNRLFESNIRRTSEL